MEDNISVTQLYPETDINERIALAALVPQWCRTVLVIVMSVVVLIGLPGNTMIILLQVKNKKKTSTDWFVTFLAISDVLSLIVSVPVYSIIMADMWLNIGSSFGCRLHHLVIHFSFIAPTMIIACIAVDRMWKTKSVNLLITPKRAFYICIICFVVSLVLGTVAGFTRSNNILGQCVRDNSKILVQLVLYGVLALIVLSSNCIIIISYVHVLVHLRRRNESNFSNVNPETAASSFRVGRFRKAIETTKLMLVVTIVFIFLTTIPSVGAIGLATTEYRKHVYGKVVLFFTTRLYLINNCANPVFYFCLNPDFRSKTISFIRNK